MEVDNFDEGAVPEFIPRPPGRGRMRRAQCLAAVVASASGRAHVACYCYFFTSRLRRLVLRILHSMFFAKKNNKNTCKNREGNLADICDVISRDYIVAFP